MKTKKWNKKLFLNKKTISSLNQMNGTYGHSRRDTYCGQLGCRSRAEGTGCP